MRVAATVLVIAGCSFNPATAIDAGESGDPDVIDAPVTLIDAAIDAHQLAPCPPPAAGCTAFACAGSSNCYYTCATTRNNTDAATRCEQDGMGCLVTINDATENACVTASTVPPPIFPNLIWIGYVQAPGSVEPGGGWGWRCGTSSFVAPNWGSFEPTDTGGNEDCGSMNEGAAWIDASCNSAFRYICEFPRL